VPPFLHVTANLPSLVYDKNREASFKIWFHIGHALKLCSVLYLGHPHYYAIQYNAVAVLVIVIRAIITSDPQRPNRAGVLRGVTGVPGSRIPGVTISVLKNKHTVTNYNFHMADSFTTYMYITHMNNNQNCTNSNVISKIKFSVLLQCAQLCLPLQLVDESPSHLHELNSCT
jgi:hypothetical protein